MKGLNVLPYSSIIMLTLLIVLGTLVEGISINFRPRDRGLESLYDLGIKQNIPGNEATGKNLAVVLGVEEGISWPRGCQIKYHHCLGLSKKLTKM